MSLHYYRRYSSQWLSLLRSNNWERLSKRQYVIIEGTLHIDWACGGAVTENDSINAFCWRKLILIPHRNSRWWTKPIIQVVQRVYYRQYSLEFYVFPKYVKFPKLRHLTDFKTTEKNLFSSTENVPWRLGLRLYLLSLTYDREPERSLNAKWLTLCRIVAWTWSQSFLVSTPLWARDQISKSVSCLHHYSVPYRQGACLWPTYR